jgi:hypothetical protein
MHYERRLQALQKSATFTFIVGVDVTRPWNIGRGSEGLNALNNPTL